VTIGASARRLSGVGYGAPPVKLVGLTGGIGAGKSSVSALLAAKGAVIVDADAIVREVQSRGTEVFDAIVERFGAGVVGPDGELDRPALAAIVFGDPDALKELNALVHPAVGVEVLRRVDEQRGTDSVVVLDVPLLVESGRHSASGVIVVDVPVEVAVERLVRDRGMTEDEARARMARQASREERLAKADLVIDNSGSREALAAAVDRAWAWIATLPDEPA
jgi:dephospho-CoA kinase